MRLSRCTGVGLAEEDDLELIVSGQDTDSSHKQRKDGKYVFLSVTFYISMNASHWKPW